jgi:hypothetical protein
MAKSKPSAKDPYSNRTFFDGLDSYEDEFQLWKTNLPVTSLVGVFELPEDAFYSSIEDSLRYVGKGSYSVLYYNSEVGRSNEERRGSVGTGYACAVRNTYGKVQPVIFVRENINGSGTAASADIEQESNVKVDVRSDDKEIVALRFKVLSTTRAPK